MEAAERTVPFNLECEQALLGALLMENSIYAKVSPIVSADDFFEDVHRLTFEAFASAMAAGRAATPITIKSYLPDIDLGGVTVSQYLARLAASATSLRHADEYARTVHDLAVRRRLISIAMDAQDEAFTAGIEASAVEMARSAITKIHETISAGSDVKQAASIGTIAHRVFQNAAEKLQGTAVEAPTTGLTDLDRALGGGFRSGRLLVIAARPGAGKTVVLCSTARQAAAAGHGVLVFSLEIDEEEIGSRILSDASVSWGSTKLPYINVMNGWLNASDAEILYDLEREVKELPLRVDASSGLTMAEIELRTRMEADRMARAGQKLRVVMIDYLQLVRASKTYRGNRVEELGEIALHAKEMGKRLGVCVVLLCQINRGTESREDKRPMLSDLRGSGEIEEHADVVAMLYREAYYIEKSPEYQRGEEGAVSVYLSKQHDLEIILAKNRLGPVRTVNVWADMKFNAIRSKAML